MWKIFLGFLCFLVITTMALGDTPYHTINLNSFSDVTRALEKPEWLFNYTQENFQYKSDEEQFGKFDFPQSAQEMFGRKQGDCEDYGAFNNYVLKLHGYNPQSWCLARWGVAHVVNIFKSKSKWWKIDNIGLTSHTTKEDALNAGLENYSFKFEYIYPDREFIEQKSEKLVGENFLPIEDCLVEQDFGIQIFTPLMGYMKSPHKEALGILTPISFFYLDGIGASISYHGFYSASSLTNKKMYSLHFLFNRIGLSIHKGDYSGETISWQVVKDKHINLFLISRDEEIIDWKLAAKFDTFQVKLSKYDKKISFWLEKSFFVGGIEIGKDHISAGNKYGGFTFSNNILYFLGRWIWKERD